VAAQAVQAQLRQRERLGQILYLQGLLLLPQAAVVLVYLVAVSQVALAVVLEAEELGVVRELQDKEMLVVAQVLLPDLQQMLVVVVVVRLLRVLLARL
jgi:hypothetical protein